MKIELKWDEKWTANHHLVIKILVIKLKFISARLSYILHLLIMLNIELAHLTVNPCLLDANKLALNSVITNFESQITRTFPYNAHF